MDMGVSHNESRPIPPYLDPNFSSQMAYGIKETQPGPPHESLFFVLAYLPVFELLAVSQVCRSLRDAVNHDVLLWLNIIVDRPLNLRLSDDILIKITSKSNGKLRTLALMNCAKVTDDGLQHVIEQNPLISKLYVPACTGLTPEGVTRAVKTLTKHHHNLDALKIHGIYNMKKEHLETLQSCLQMKSTLEEGQQEQQPTLFHDYRNFSALNGRGSNRRIDVQICPKCNGVQMLFECPREACKRKREKPKDECRGCYFCIARCEECGGCVDEEEVGEAACEDMLCFDCWLRLPKCNFCNKAYCKRHVDRCCTSSSSSGFVCGVCHAKFIRDSCN